MRRWAATPATAGSTAPAWAPLRHACASACMTHSSQPCVRERDGEWRKCSSRLQTACGWGLGCLESGHARMVGTRMPYLLNMIQCSVSNKAAVRRSCWMRWATTAGSAPSAPLPGAEHALLPAGESVLAAFLMPCPAGLLTKLRLYYGACLAAIKTIQHSHCLPDAKSHRPACEGVLSGMRQGGGVAASGGQAAGGARRPCQRQGGRCWQETRPPGARPSAPVPLSCAFSTCLLTPRTAIPRRLRSHSLEGLVLQVTDAMESR